MEENFNQIKLRIIEYADIKKISIRKLCEKISINPSNFSKGNMKSALNCDAMCRFLNTFPDVNIEWILLGKGEILRKEGEILSENGENFVVSEKIFREILEENQKLNREIGRLEGEIERLKKAAAPEAGSAECAAAAI